MKTTGKPDKERKGKDRIRFHSIPLLIRCPCSYKQSACVMKTTRKPDKKRKGMIAQLKNKESYKYANWDRIQRK